MSTAGEVSIAVVIPVYNGAATVNEALESVRRQSVQPAEVLVIDDGSGDDTGAVVEAYLREHQLPPTWRLMTQANRGPAGARDLGIRSAATTHVALLDADDVWHPDKLAISVRLLITHGYEVIGASLQADSTQADIRPVSRQRMLFKNPFFTSTAVFSRSAYRDVGGFDCGQRYSEDYKLWLAFAWLGHSCGLMSSPYATYRPHTTGAHQGLSSRRWQMQRHEIGNFRWLRRIGSLPWYWSVAAQAFSWLKFVRRIVFNK